MELINATYRKPNLAAGRNTRLALGIGLSPLWLLAFFFVASPAFLDPLRTDAVAIAGLPAGVAFVLAIGLLTLAGTLVIRRARSRAVLAAAMFLLTFPALVLVVMAPAAILVLANVQS